MASNVSDHCYAKADLRFGSLADKCLRKRTFIGSFVPLSERWMVKAAFASF